MTETETGRYSIHHAVSPGEQFRLSLGEVKSTRTLAVCGMFAAVGVVLGYFTISIGNFLKIGFSSLPNQCIYALFGPAVGAMFGGILDILKYMIRPTGPFFPGFTLNAVLAGLIYGFSFYKRPVTFRRVLLTEACVSLICNILLSTLWISALYGHAFLALLPMRALKNIIQVPINAFLFYLVDKNILKSRIFQNLRME